MEINLQKPKSYKKLYTHVIKDLNGEEVIIKTSVSIKKCYNCGWNYLFKNKKLLIGRHKGTILKNIFHGEKYFHNKACKRMWIIKSNSF